MRHIQREHLLARRRALVLGAPVDLLTKDEAAHRVMHWATSGESRMVCLCNVHSVVTAHEVDCHRDALQGADLVAPDGAPVAWMLRWTQGSEQARVAGPDLMWTCCGQAALLGIKMFLYGGTPKTLHLLQQRLRKEFENVQIVGALSPPFRPLSESEDAAVVDTINQSGARIVWVALGCPKQEAWMLAHRPHLRAVMIGVGAAFEFHAAVLTRAPKWMQNAGLEWLYRFSQDPARLAKRYCYTNTAFVLRAVAELTGGRARSIQRESGA
jgi:N-acetylglucosaminyldiphosphoundecaprenol N-acetyl-beta-D-mannosaminyltransferase